MVFNCNGKIYLTLPFEVCIAAGVDAYRRRSKFEVRLETQEDCGMMENQSGARKFELTKNVDVDHAQLVDGGISNSNCPADEAKPA